MPTIKDIAREAGVSHGTVSNVLNKTGKVSTEKIRRVEEAARKLGYAPNAQAQLLRQNAARQIAVILPTISEETYRNFYLAFQNLAQQKGFRTELYQTNDITANEEQILSSLSLPSLAAVISIPAPGAQCCSLYENIQCPVIFINRNFETHTKEYIQVQFDFSQIGSHLSEYARRHCWKNIAFFSTAGDPSDEQAIYNCFCAALADSAVSVQKFTSDNYLLINHAFDLLTQGTAFDGIITVGSLRSDAIESALRFLGNSCNCELLCIGSAQTFSKTEPHIYELDYGAMAMKIMIMLEEHLRSRVPFPPLTVLPPKGFAFFAPSLASDTEEQLSMLTLESPTTTALEQLSPFLQEMTGIRLKITSMSYDDLYTQIEMSRENCPHDLIRMDMAWMDELGQKIYMPLSATGALGSKAIQSVAENAHFGYTHSCGVLCALPFDPSVQVLLYRQDLFEDAVLQRAYYETFHEALTVPQTMEQWYHIAQFFTHSLHPDSPTLYGTSITGGNTISAACDFLPHYFSEGGKLYDNQGHALLDTPTMRIALKNYRERQKYAKPQGELWWRDSVRQFADGNVATVLTFSNHAAYIMNNRYTNIMQKTGVTMVPGGSPLLGGGVLGISRHTAKTDACRRFFDWLYHPDIASAIVRLGGASPIQEAYSTYDNYSVFPWLKTIGETFSTGTRGIGGHYLPGFCAQDYETAIGTAVYRMIHNNLSPDEAAAMAQALYRNKVSCDTERPR